MKIMLPIVSVLMLLTGVLFSQDDSSAKTRPAGEAKQEEKSVPEDPKVEKEGDPIPDSRERAMKAISGVLEKGGYRLGGSVKNESMMGGLGVMIGGMGGITGEVEGEFAVSAMEEMSHLVMEKKEWRLDVFSLNEQTVCRQTWKGRQVNTDSFKNEVAKLVNWKGLMPVLSEVEDFETTTPRDVDGVECTVIEGTLPVGFLDDAGDKGTELMPGMTIQLKQIRKIEVEFCIGKEDSRLQRIRFNIKKGASDFMKAQMGGLGDKEKEEMPEGFGMEDIMSEETTYTFRVTESGLEKGPEIPDDVLKFLQF